MVGRKLTLFIQGRNSSQHCLVFRKFAKYRHWTLLCPVCTKTMKVVVAEMKLVTSVCHCLNFACCIN